jgi:hypothetical protein
LAGILGRSKKVLAVAGRTRPQERHLNLGLFGSVLALVNIGSILGGAFTPKGLVMNYSVQFQYLSKGGSPVDHPAQSDFATDDRGFGLIPDVGDYVEIEPLANSEQAARFAGKVRNRLFTYFDKDQCNINIVVEETDHDWKLLGT